MLNLTSEKKMRYLLAALLAVGLILLLAAPVLAVDAFIAKISYTYLDLIKMAFDIGGDATGVGLLMVCAAVAAAATLVLTLLPNRVSERDCGRSGAASGAFVVVLLLLLRVAGNSVMDEMGLPSSLADNFYSAWIYIDIALMAAVCCVGILLARMDGGHAAVPRVAKKPHSGVAVPVQPVASGNPQAASGLIEGRNGAYAGSSIPLTPGSTLVIGRDPQVANIVIMHNNSDISRRHCALRMDPQGACYYVTDYSRNGTYWNSAQSHASGSALPKNIETPLPRNTLLTLGKNGTVFYLH